MVGDQDPVDSRHLIRLWPAKGVKGGLILAVRVYLPEGVDQAAIVGQEAVGGGTLVSIEVAGNDERGLRADLIEPVPQNLGVSIDGRRRLKIEMGVDVSQHGSRGLAGEPGPGYCSGVRAAPTHAAGDLRGLAQPEASRIENPEG